jgi:hypothetical protein
LDEHIYLIGNNAVALYRFAIAGTAFYAADQWVGPAILIPITARTAAPGVGSTLNWMPDVVVNLNPGGLGVPLRANDYLFSLRGGGSALLDSFRISTAVWQDPTVIAVLNPPETFNVGTCAVYDPTDIPSIIAYRNATMSLRALSCGTGDLLSTMWPANSMDNYPMGTYAGVDGVAHEGNLLTYVRFEDGTTYYYMAKHSERTFMRLLRVA